MNRIALLVLPVLVFALLLTMACEEPADMQADASASSVEESSATATADTAETTEATEPKPTVVHAQPAEEEAPAEQTTEKQRVVVTPETPEDSKPQEEATDEASADTESPTESAEPTDEAATQGQAPAAEELAEQEAADPNAVIATVGKTEITAGDLMDAYAALRQRNPRQAAQVSPRDVLDSLMREQLIEAFVEKHQLTYEEAELEKFKTSLAEQAEQMGMTFEQAMDSMGMTIDELKTQLKLQNYVEPMVTTEKLREFATTHKNYFDGTEVSASHILIKLPPAVTTAQQKQALEKLQSLKKQIEAGEITFAEAARTTSHCPSAKAGGDLGPFVFYQMAMPFSMKAFDMEEGEISDPVRTQFGFHIIKKTGETMPEDPKAVPAHAAEPLAQQAIMSQVRNDIMDLSLQGQPLVITEEGENLLPPAEQTPLPGMQAEQEAPADETAPAAEESADEQ